MVVQIIIKRPVQPKVCMAQGGSRFMLPRTKKLDRSRASDRSYAYARAARGRSAYFRNHLTSERRAYFRLAGQLSQLCAQTLHIFAYYPRTNRSAAPRASARPAVGETQTGGADTPTATQASPLCGEIKPLFLGFCQRGADAPSRPKQHAAPLPSCPRAPHAAMSPYPSPTATSTQAQRSPRRR